MSDVRQLQAAPQQTAPAPSNAALSPAHPHAIVREVAALILRPHGTATGYRTPAFAEIKALCSLAALEQSCQQDAAMIALYIERIGQLEAEAAVRAA